MLTRLAGGDRPDKILGGPGNDGINGQNGRDVIRAGKGDDLIIANVELADKVDGLALIHNLREKHASVEIIALAPATPAKNIIKKPACSAPSPPFI